MKLLPRLFIGFLFLVFILFSKCKKDDLFVESGGTLEFSTDTVLFDTVFTTVGSTTEYLKVYNRENRSVRISSLFIEQGSQSQYRINVDGIPGSEHTDVVIGPKDSMYIFIEVTVDPNNSNTPLILEDNLVFVTNGEEQRVNLAAWGRDAYFHGNLGSLFTLDCDEIWNSDKPHVIYGLVAVDSCCTLTINQGTEVYFHNNSSLLVYKGTLNVNGTTTSRVTFQGDRLESFYDDVAGQWGLNSTGA